MISTHATLLRLLLRLLSPSGTKFCLPHVVGVKAVNFQSPSSFGTHTHTFESNQFVDTNDLYIWGVGAAAGEEKPLIACWRVRFHFCPGLSRIDDSTPPRHSCSSLRDKLPHLTVVATGLSLPLSPWPPIYSQLTSLRPFSSSGLQAVSFRSEMVISILSGKFTWRRPYVCICRE